VDWLHLAQNGSTCGRAFIPEHYFAPKSFAALREAFSNRMLARKCRIRQNINVLFVDTPCSYPHSFCTSNEYWPSDQCGLDSRVMVEVGDVL
jgi:hypothetical protein